MKDSFIFEGKKYISARRASEISDYASDYVGQLCRAGKLDCRMIGRSWFVTEESIHLHKAAISREEASRSRIENLRGKSIKTSVQSSDDNSTVNVSNDSTSVTAKVTTSSIEQVSIEAPSTSSVSLPKVVIPVVVQTSAFTPAPWTVEAPIKSPFIYSSDDRPLLPVLKTKSSVQKDDVKSPIVVSEASQKILINKIDDTNNRQNVSIVSSVTSSSASSTLSITSVPASKITPSTTSQKTKTNPISKSAVSQKVSADAKPSKSYGFKNVISYPELTREIILKRIIAPVFAFAILFGLGTGTYIVADKVGNSSTAVQFAGSIQASGANVSDAFARAYSGIKSGYKSVVAFFTSPSQLAVNIPKEFGDVVVSEVTPNGIVLSPSAGSEVADDAMKQKIRASFSDDVNISSDGSGTAGVITPVFKDTNGKDFIYVMVPVKDAQNNDTE